MAAEGAVVISEVAKKGSSQVCDGNDWTELFNTKDETESLIAYVLHDDKGLSHPNAFSFPDVAVIDGLEYLLLCHDSATVNSNSMSPQFGIGKDDTLTLVKFITAAAEGDNMTDVTAVERSTKYQIVDTVGPLPQDPSADRQDITYALDESTGSFAYTSQPTPGSANVILRLLTDEEWATNVKAKLREQNDLGTAFFGMDNQGHPVYDEMFPTVLELHLEMLGDDYDALVKNPEWETYQPFQTASLKNPETGDSVWSRTVPGRIRAKGQSGLFVGICLGTETLPFQLDFSSPDMNQTLFGAEKVALRHHMQDYSFMREWAYNRMLARFGLPHVRARKVLAFINGNLAGFYTLLEAHDQDYVFNRNFPDYDPLQYSLYKVKTYALNCGLYSDEQQSNATLRAEELQDEAINGTWPPYKFERGSHIAPVTERGILDSGGCIEDFYEDYRATVVDSVVAYSENNGDCGKMLVKEGLVDLDLGSKDDESSMEQFLNVNFRGDSKCAPGCKDSTNNVASEMDVSQVLRTLAFYSTNLISDSPIISGNNFYLAKTDDTSGWKVVSTDFNSAGILFCKDVCNSRAIHYSIARPTCEALEEQPIVGPLLSDPVLFHEYLGYARSFVNTVMTNSTLLEEMEAHVRDIDPFVRSDSWSFFGAFFDKELSVDAADPTQEDDRFPLLPTMKARANDLLGQFAAMDSGTFPRGPNSVGVGGDNDAWEACPDWRASEPDTSACEMGCEYDGCHMPEYTVQSFCDEDTGTCYHADVDAQCRGVYEEDRYAGMADTADGRNTFCSSARGIPVKAVECPDPGSTLNTSAASSIATGLFSIPMSLIVALALARLYCAD